MKNQIILSIYLLILLGCRNKEIDSLGDFEQNRELTGKRLSISPNSFVYPNKIMELDSFLIVEDSDKNKHFRIVDLRNMSVKLVGTMGNGPGELTFPTSIQKIPRSNSLGLFIRPKFIFAQISLNDLINDRLDYFDSNNRFDINHQKLIKVNDSVFVGIGLFNKRYALSDGMHKLINTQNDYPFATELKYQPLEVIGMAYQGDIDVKPDGTKIIISSEYSINLQISKIDGYTIIPEKTIDLTFPQFKAGEGNVISTTMSKDNIRGFLDVSVTNNLIFLLYSGKAQSNSVGSAIVYVFSWNGDPKYKFLLDREVVCIAASSDEKYLYAVEYGKEPFVTVFDLEME